MIPLKFFVPYLLIEFHSRPLDNIIANLHVIFNLFTFSIQNNYIDGRRDCIRRLIMDLLKVFPPYPLIGFHNESHNNIVYTLVHMLPSIYSRFHNI